MKTDIKKKFYKYNSSLSVFLFFIIAVIFCIYTWGPLVNLVTMPINKVSASGTFVQSKMAYSLIEVLNKTVILDSSVGTGNLIVVGITEYRNNNGIAIQGPGVQSVTDNKGNTYIKATQQPTTLTNSDTTITSIWYAENVSGGSSFTVTATATAPVFTNPDTFITIAAHEYSGMVTSGALDQTGFGVGTGTAAAAGNVTISQPDEVIFGNFLPESDNNTPTAGSGFTIYHQQLNGNYMQFVSEGKIVSAGGSYNANLTWTSSTFWRGAVATFKIAGSPTTTVATTTAITTTTATTTAATSTTATSTTAPTTTVVTTTAGTTTIPNTSNATFSIGQGFNDNVPHQMIRADDDKLYVFAGRVQGGAIIKAYWTNSAGLPSFSADFNGSAQITDANNIISTDISYDGGTIIHVLVNTQGGNLKDYPFDTSTDTFKSPITISTGNPTVSGDYIGSVGVGSMFDSLHHMHIAYWSPSNHISYREYTYTAGSNTLTLISGPTQIDTAGSSNHPSIAISPVDDSITVVWVSEATTPKKILTTTRVNGGAWGSISIATTSPVWTSTSAGINIDQGPSLVIDSLGIKKLTYIEDFDGTGDYGRLHYSNDNGSGWVDQGTSFYTHAPGIGTNNGNEVFILGHGHPNNSACISLIDICLYKRNTNGTWQSPITFLTHSGTDTFDASVTTKWSAYHWNRPETVEFLFFSAINQSYYNTNLWYGRLANYTGSTVTPVTTTTATTTTAPTTTPATTSTTVPVTTTTAPTTTGATTTIMSTTTPIITSVTSSIVTSVVSTSTPVTITAANVNQTSGIFITTIPTTANSFQTSTESLNLDNSISVSSTTKIIPTTTTPVTEISFTKSGIFRTINSIGKTILSRDGGSLALTNGSTDEIVLTMPSGFSDNDAAFEIRKLDAASVFPKIESPTSVSPVETHIYELISQGADGNLITSFKQPIAINIKYTPEEINLYEEDSLKVYRRENNQWSELSSCKHIKKSHEFKCTTTGFSLFGVFGKLKSPDNVGLIAFVSSVSAVTLIIVGTLTYAGFVKKPGALKKPIEKGKK